MVSFTETPSEAKFSNNKSALTYSAFVQTAIKGMLLSETMKQLKTSPRSYHSSFCVSVNLKDKKQLLLDLGYLFKFDLKKRLPTHQYISAAPNVSWFLQGF